MSGAAHPVATGAGYLTGQTVSVSGAFDVPL